MIRTHFLWSLAAGALLTPAAFAADIPVTEPVAPPPPKRYTVEIRYGIDAFRNERVAQFSQMIGFFNKLGFDQDEGPEDEAENSDYTRMSGTIPSANARLLIREPHVRRLLLRPAGMKLPAGNALVRVQIEIVDSAVIEPGRFLYPTRTVRSFEQEAGAALARRQELHQRTLTILKDLGFEEAVAYDRRAFTRLVGKMPAGNLPELLRDVVVPGLPGRLSWQWFWKGPKYALPVLVTEILDLPVPADDAPAPPPVEVVKPRRLEVLLAEAPPRDDRTWVRAFAPAIEASFLEGYTGRLVTVRVPPGQDWQVLRKKLEALPEVIWVRPPISGQLPPTPSLLDSPEAIRASGLLKLHALNRRGQGARIAIVDGDFRGWEEVFARSWWQPVRVRLVDLTAARNADLLPDPPPPGPGLGHGTQIALAASKAAPDAELLLVRVDPEVPYHLATVVQAASGAVSEMHHSGHDLNSGCQIVIPVSSGAVEMPGMGRRLLALDALRPTFDVRREELRRKWEIFRDELSRRGIPSDDIDADPNPITRKQAHERKLQLEREGEELKKSEREFLILESRFVKYSGELRRLSTITIGVSGLVWHRGYAVDGGGVLARLFDDLPLHGPPWVVPAGDIRNQTWAGVYRDADHDEVMEFRAVQDPMKAGEPHPAPWDFSLNFLKWQSADGKQTFELPANTRLRISVQWREAHDSSLTERDYRRPLAALRLVLLRQLDPSGKTRPADDFQRIARSLGPPLRIETTPNSAVYEETLEITIPENGHYALRLEMPSRVDPFSRRKVAPTSSNRPLEAPTTAPQAWELRPRILLETPAGNGRVVFGSFVSTEGSVATPGDARRVLTVGAVDLPVSSTGPILGMELFVKPTVVVAGVKGENALSPGTSLASGFAAGWLACMANTGIPPEKQCGQLKAWPGRPLHATDVQAAGR
jgi:hypothetical protein